MSKVRINDLARELEVKSKGVLDILKELGLGAGKTHSSSLEEQEADQVRAHFERGKPAAAAASTHAAKATQTIQPKIDLSHISKPGDVLKAVLAKHQEEEEAAKRGRMPVSRRRQSTASRREACAPGRGCGSKGSRCPAEARAAQNCSAAEAGARYCGSAAGDAGNCLPAAGRCGCGQGSLGGRGTSGSIFGAACGGCGGKAARAARTEAGRRRATSCNA